MSSLSLQPDSPWPHRLAVALVAVTFPLIWVGGLVTTYEAGMAVPDWPTTYGYNLFLYPWQTWLFGPWDLFIEHGHRLLGAAAGLATIGLAVALWRFDARPWMRWLGIAAVAAVAAQGLLGGMRVLWDERLLARWHACTGPLFFALTVALAVFTSRRWLNSPPAREHPQAAKLRWLAWFTTGLAYVQIVLGARLRHASIDLEPGEFADQVVWHLLMAGILAIHVVLLGARIGWHHRDEPALQRPAVLLVGLLGCQLLLGAGTWIVNYGWPAWFGGYAFAQGYVVRQASQPQTLVTTAHVANGSLILATSLLITLRSLRLYRSSARPVALPAATLEVVA